MFIRQLFADRLSVRVRVAALGVVPIIGFLAYGIAYMASDIEVGRAFDSVRRDTAVVDASSELKGGPVGNAARHRDIRDPSHRRRGQSLRPGAAAGDEDARPYRSLAGVVAAGCDHAAAHHHSRPESQLRKPGQCRARARLRRNPGHDRRPDRRQRRDRAHRQQRIDMGRRSRFGETPGIAAHHAALRSRISPQPASLLDATGDAIGSARHRAALSRRDQTLQRHLRLGRRPAGGQAEAQQGGADLQLYVCPVGRQHRQHRAAADADRPRHRERAARGR